MTSYRIPALAPLPTEPRWQLPAPLLPKPRSLVQPELAPPGQKEPWTGAKGSRGKAKRSRDLPESPDGVSRPQASQVEASPGPGIRELTEPALGVPAQGGNPLGLPAPLLALLQRRGFDTAEAIGGLLDPPPAPEPADHFADLDKAVTRLRQACKAAEAVAICGDYDADGMTSTALLVGVLQRLGAKPQAAIPSRQEDGYGLNVAMVERLHGEGVGLLVTVDNGVAAREALLRAQALGLDVILTDHHSLPDELPPFLALLHPI